MADKIDFKKTLDTYRAASGKFRIVDVPEMQYLKIDGRGDPNTSPEYSAALEALYPVAYKLKFASKRELGLDYVVPPLEGLWWAADMEAFTAARDKSQWEWTMMIMTPDWIEQSLFESSLAAVGAKNPPAKLDAVRLVFLTEGRCAQTLHIGSFDDEAEVLERMHNDFIPENGFHMTGKHHEIYFSDPRKVAPEKMRTILRQPVGASIT